MQATVAPLENSSAPGAASACRKNSIAFGYTTLVFFPEGSEKIIWEEVVQSTVTCCGEEDRDYTAYVKVYD